MKKEYTLIENEKYKLIIILDNNDFDYYTDIRLDLIFAEKDIVIFNDNLLALKNIVEQSNEAVHILDGNLNEKSLGVLLNEYYRCLYENQMQEVIVLDNQGQWVGEKYNCFSNLEYATWIYKYAGNIIIKVTPIFGGFEEDDYIQEYKQFIKNYEDVFKETISLQQLKTVKKIILELYDELF